jgi:DNA-binding NarL/FixJ family response regulator
MPTTEVHVATVVVAEASQAVQRQAAAVLRKKHLRVSPVKDRESLVEAVASLLPALVLLDFTFEKEMPSLVQALRRVSPGSPVLIVVDKTKTSHAAAAAALGAADLLLKPFSAFELGYRVERCLQAGHVARAAAVRLAAERGELDLSPPMVPLARPSAARLATEFSPLRDRETGRLDAKRIAEYLDVPLKQFAEAIRENYKALHKTPSKASLQDKLLPIERTISLLDERLRDRGRVRAWLHTPHPDLGNRTALGVILEGHAVIVSDMLESAAAGLTS